MPDIRGSGRFAPRVVQTGATRESKGFVDAAERHVLDAVPVGLQIWEAVGDDARSLTLRYANEEANRQAGIDVMALVGRTVGDIFPGEGPWTETVHDACLAQEMRTLELPYVDEGIGETWWRARVTPLGGRSVLAAYWNVTEHKLAERSLRASAQLNREIVAGLQEGVIVVDTAAKIVLANDAAARLFGVAVDELVGRPLSGVPLDVLDDAGRLIGPDRLPLERALRGDHVRGAVVRFVRRDGSLLWVEVHSNPLSDESGELYGAVASYDDVTLRVEQDRRTRHEADHDPLTGLANRRALERTLETALSRASARGRSVGVLMLDLDGFKGVNDRHGHAAGDQALREVARRLRRCVRERDLVARLGGDEFVVVLTDLGGTSGAAQDSCERVNGALAEPIAVEGAEVSLRGAIGVARFPEDGGDAPALLAYADRAMYIAKAANRSLRQAGGG
jgi:diguanylate cyclase (GGDEF)-like protein/PAS domain S-box-containing protein